MIEQLKYTKNNLIKQIQSWMIVLEPLYLRYVPSYLGAGTKALNQYANIGFNSTKQLHYYGFKGNFEVSNQGIIVAYTITKASIHDIKSVKTLINEYPCKRILADQGYLSKSLKHDLAKHNIWFWTPRRSNMTPYRYNDQLLKRRRRYIETVFAKLEALFDIEHNNAQSLKGFNTRLEQCLLVDTIRKIN